MKRRPTRNQRTCLFLLITLTAFIIIYLSPSVWGQKTYKVAILPEYLPIVIYEKFDPLLEYLKRELDVNFELIIPKNFNEHMQMIKNGTVDFSYQNPYVVLELSPYIQPLVITEKGKKWGIEGRGVIIAKADGGITKPDDLVGKRVSIVSFHSADGYIAQKNFLKGMMINVNTDYKVYETNINLHVNVMEDVLRKNADAGFLCEELFTDPDSVSSISAEDLDFKSINIIARTSYIPNWIFSARKNMKPAFINEVKKVLLNIPIDSEVLKAAKIRRFVQIPSNYLEEYRSKNEP